MRRIGKDSNPEDLFLVSEAGEYSYADLQYFSDEFQSKIKPFDHEPEQPLGLLANSTDELVFIIATCWLNNIPFVPFNPEIPPKKLQHQINRINPGFIITDQPGEIGAIRTKSIKEFTEFLNAKQWKRNNAAGTGNLSENPENIFGYLFTSGTTGTAKIVPLKRRQMISAADSFAGILQPDPNKCWLLCLPLYHIGGTAVILRSLLYGSAVFRLNRFDTEKIVGLMKSARRITTASLVPTMLERLLKESNFGVQADFKGILLGGGSISSSLLEKCMDKNIRVIPSYGMTETCAVIAANPISDKPNNSQKLQSAGRLFNPNKIQIRGDEDKLLETGEPGIIWLKGPQVFDGYLHNQKNSFDENGWFNTGDYGYLDKDDHLFIENRREDLIITGGENVSPAEVEEVLTSIDAIKEAAVLGMPDKEWGQKIVAAVVFIKGMTISQAAIQEKLNEQLEPFKIPKEIAEVESLPRTDTGKIKRKKLVALFRSL